MGKKIRITKLIVLPVAFVDDGVNLEEISIDQLEVPASEIDKFVATGLKEALDSLREQDL